MKPRLPPNTVHPHRLPICEARSKDGMTSALCLTSDLFPLPRQTLARFTAADTRTGEGGSGGGGHVRQAQAGKQPDQTHRVSVAAWTLPESHDFKDALTEHQERWVVLFL